MSRKIHVVHVEVERDVNVVVSQLRDGHTRYSRIVVDLNELQFFVQVCKRKRAFVQWRRLNPPTLLLHRTRGNLFR
jgi:hypothetical protein